MMFKIILSIFVMINAVICGVLILSPKKIEISSLQAFNFETYQFLKESFQNGKIVAFKLSSGHIPVECEHLLQNKFTSYVTTLEYIPENVIELNPADKQNCDAIKNTIQTLDLESRWNTVYLILHNPNVVKRSAGDDEQLSSMEEPLGKEKNFAKEKPVSQNGSVLYDGKGVMLVYSSKLLYLKYQNISEYYLGSTTLITINNRDTIYKLICTIPVGEGKIILQFLFPWDSGYWSLNMVEIWDVKGTNYNLSNSNQISAPRGFSYRCGGETVFSDGNYTLILYDMQVQPQTTGSRFSDAYNCVPFMTGPIWSGILVTSILCIGLFIGLAALGSIKTMDKFDNSKTKQLTITVMGE